MNNKNSKIWYILHYGTDVPYSAAYNRVNTTVMGMKKYVDVELVKISTRLSKYARVEILKQMVRIIETIKIYRICKKAKKHDVFIIYGLTPSSVMFRIFRRKIILICERNEYPHNQIYKDIGGGLDKMSRKYEEALKYIDGMITCSEELAKYYRTKVSSEVSIYVMPLIIDLKKFITEYKREEYIGYCGALNFKKDGIGILIEAMTKISKYNVKLKIVGRSGKREEEKVKKLIKDTKQEHNIEILGILDHSRIPEFIGKAKVMVLARPTSMQARGGIPSKVGEYLASGTPTVITRVGELPNYLHDGIDCYISEPDSSESFARKLEEALLDPDRNAVGMRGRKAVKIFDMYAQAKHLNEYLEAVRLKRNSC